MGMKGFKNIDCCYNHSCNQSQNGLYQLTSDEFHFSDKPIKNFNLLLTTLQKLII